MSKDLISKKTRNELREYFVGTTLRTIEMEFDAADVFIDENYKPNVSGARRSLVEQYYNSIDWKKWRDVQKILEVYANVLSHHEDNFGNGYDWPEQGFKSLKKWIERDGYRYENGKIKPATKNIPVHDVTKIVARFDAPEIQRQINRIRDSIEDDPGLAIGTAKELVETTCKTILNERGKTIDRNWDIIQLVKETRKILDLLPDSVPDSARGVDTIRKLLSNLGTVSQGLGELRNLYGTGHGRGGQAQGLSPRHARLAVGAASTLATFLFETHEERTF